MSFDIYNKPNLVEPKLYKYYNNKLRTKELKKKIKHSEIVKQKQVLNIPIIKSNTWYNKIFTSIWEVIKMNYGFFLIISLISILLYVRYIEVNLRKKKMNDVMNNINQEKEINQFIELQKINHQLRQYE